MSSSAYMRGVQNGRRMAARARTVSVTVPLSSGTLGTLPSFDLLTPIVYTKTGGSSNLTLSGSSYAAAVALAAGTSQSITGTATGSDGCVYPWTLTCTGQAATPNLAGLTLSASAATVGTAATINILGATAGSFITGAVPDGMTLNSAARTITGLPTTAGAYNFTLTETLAGATGSPKSSNVTITVAASSAAYYLASSRSLYPGFDGAAQSDGTVTIQRQRISHFNDSEQLMQKVRLLYVGSAVTLLSEMDGPNAIQVRCSIEYPAGTFTQCIDDASAALTNVGAAGTPVAMTTATAVNIPPGAQFWERVEVIVSSGAKWCNGPLVNTALGETVERDTATGTDKTMGGIITNAGTTAPAGLMFGAAAVLGLLDYAPPVRAAIMGDSISAGRGDTTIDSRGHYGWCARAISGVAPFLWMSFSSSSLTNNIAGGFTRRLALMQAAGVTHVHAEWVVNDLRGPRTEAQIATSIGQLKALLDPLGMTLILNTCSPNTTQTPALPPIVADQTPYNSGFSAGATSERGKYNAKVRSLAYGNVAYIEAADPVETGRDTGLWAGLWSGATADMSADLLHHATAGHSAAVAVATPVWNTRKGVPRAPGNITAPAITGTAQVGYTLSVSNGVWSFTPTGYAYQWYAAGVAISGATAATYAPVAGDVGKTITCRVTATNAGGSTNTTSAVTAAVQAAQSLQTETTALLAAMTVQPDTARTTLIDNLIKGLKTDGVWAKIKALQIHSAHDEQAAKLDWITAAAVVTPMGSPAYTVDRGWALVVASNQYLNTGVNTSTLSGVSQNSLSHGLWVRAGTTAGAMCGLAGSAGRIIFNKSGSGGVTAAVNDAAATQLAAPGTAASRNSHHAIVRSSATATAYYNNAALIASLTTASNGVQAGNHCIGLSNATYTDANSFAFWVADGTLSAEEVTALHNRLGTYKAALGA